jgi:hypothetical protein
VRFSFKESRMKLADATSWTGNPGFDALPAAKRRTGKEEQVK